MMVFVGWWMLPAAVTVMALWFSIFVVIRVRRAVNNFEGVNGFVPIFYWLCALVATLAAWLIWALLT